MDDVLVGDALALLRLLHPSACSLTPLRQCTVNEHSLAIIYIYIYEGNRPTGGEEGSGKKRSLSLTWRVGHQSNPTTHLEHILCAACHT